MCLTLLYRKHHQYQLSCFAGDACCPLGSTAVELSYETFNTQWSSELSNVTGCLTTHAKNETLHGSGKHSVALPGRTVEFEYAFANNSRACFHKVTFTYKVLWLPLSSCCKSAVTHLATPKIEIIRRY